MLIEVLVYVIIEFGVFLGDCYVLLWNLLVVNLDFGLCVLVCL